MRMKNSYNVQFVLPLIVVLTVAAAAGFAFGNREAPVTPGNIYAKWYGPDRNNPVNGAAGDLPNLHEVPDVGDYVWVEGPTQNRFLARKITHVVVQSNGFVWLKVTDTVEIPTKIP